VSWAAVLALCGGCYVLKGAGVVLAARVDPERAERWSLELLVVPVLAGLIVVQGFGSGQGLVLDARAPALLVAAVLVWRRAPLLVIVLAAAGTAALLRAV
jgi:branched-subunit amino acid transport protein